MPDCKKNDLSLVGIYPINFDYLDTIDGHPEKQMWYTCLMMAMEHARLNKEEAIAWFESDEEFVGSFLWICQALNFESILQEIRDFTLDGTRNRKAMRVRHRTK